MSWSINKFGKRANLLVKRESELLIPAEVWAGISTILSAYPERHYSVECEGYILDTTGYFSLTIKPTEQV